jgi:putative SOS response-associated peptidase YedK
MCGRYSLSTPIDVLRQRFRFEDRPNLPPRYNVAPGSPVAALRIGVDGQRHLELFCWGIVLSGKSPEQRAINAKAENLHTSWRASFASRRCLVLADGFYEWQKDTKPKQPWCFRLAERAPFAMAGVFESTPGEVMNTLVIVTTKANALVAPLHDRMPVILEGSTVDRWLDPGAPLEALLAIATPFPAERLRRYRVSPRMNAPEIDDAGCAEPWPEGPGQPRLL